MAEPTDGRRAGLVALAEREPSFDMILRDHKRMRAAGTALAEAALYTIREYDGLHRLSLAVAEWARAIADEGDRARAAQDNDGEGGA